MIKKQVAVAEALDRLEVFYGAQTAAWPVDPYHFLVWWHCGYPASDAACQRGWVALQARVGVTVEQILRASRAVLTEALRAGGMVPELRAVRLQEVAARVRDVCGGDLTAALQGREADARRLLKQFPNIADAGTDRVLLFARLQPVAAVPSNGPQVLVRIQGGVERVSYSATYKDAQALLAEGVPARFEARMRAYLLLKRHGQELCKRVKPRCDGCPLRESCGYLSRRAGAATT